MVLVLAPVLSYGLAAVEVVSLTSRLRPIISTGLAVTSGALGLSLYQGYKDISISSTKDTLTSTSDLTGFWAPLDFMTPPPDPAPPLSTPDQLPLSEYENSMEYLSSLPLDSPIIENLVNDIIDRFSSQLSEQLLLMDKNSSLTTPDLPQIVGFKHKLKENILKDAKNASSGSSAPPSNVSEKKKADLEKKKVALEEKKQDDQKKTDEETKQTTEDCNDALISALDRIKDVLDIMADKLDYFDPSLPDGDDETCPCIKIEDLEALFIKIFTSKNDDTNFFADKINLAETGKKIKANIFLDMLEGEDV